MNQIKPKNFTDKTNSLIQQMTPYLFNPDTYTTFIRKRIEAQIEEVNDFHHHTAVKIFFLFTVDRVDEAIALAEDFLFKYPQDSVSWGNYALCLSFKVSAPSAVDVCFRGFEQCHSPGLIEKGCSYASFIGDYATILKGADILAKLGVVDMHKEIPDTYLDSIVQQAIVAKKSGKLAEIQAVGMLMEDLLNSPGSPRRATLFPPDDPEDDSDCFLFEVGFSDQDFDAVSCAELNIRLINERIRNGLTDWSVMGSFCSINIKDDENACGSD